MTDRHVEEAVERRWTISICPACGSRYIWLFGVDMATPAPAHCSNEGEHPLVSTGMVDVMPVYEHIEALTTERELREEWEDRFASVDASLGDCCRRLDAERERRERAEAELQVLGEKFSNALEAAGHSWDGEITCEEAVATLNRVLEVIALDAAHDAALSQPIDQWSIGTVGFPGPKEEEECAKPPVGWRCTRETGHDGPCAAIPQREES